MAVSLTRNAAASILSEHAHDDALDVEVRFVHYDGHHRLVRRHSLRFLLQWRDASVFRARGILSQPGCSRAPEIFEGVNRRREPGVSEGVVDNHAIAWPWYGSNPIAFRLRNINMNLY